MIKLTSFSPGAGCGCKIAPSVLEEILGGEQNLEKVQGLLVGYESRDDAAVFDLGDGRAVVSTTDFFMPICDDAFDFGRIASANALSDVYAMGGKPLVAISILGWPLEKLPVEMAREVIQGSREICREAGIPLAGGHSIDSLEPIFGLAVTGMVDICHLKKNSTSRTGDVLYLTKPLGVGILSTAEKKDLLRTEHHSLARDNMVRLNKVGTELGRQSWVTAMTDVTGFGLLGHLIEMCEGSGTGAEIRFEQIPVFKEIFEYIDMKAIPGGTFRNWKSYGHKVQTLTEIQKVILCDPQTSGGLLVAIEEKKEMDFLLLMEKLGEPCYRIGSMKEHKEGVINVI